MQNIYTFIMLAVNESSAHAQLVQLKATQASAASKEAKIKLAIDSSPAAMLSFNDFIEITEEKLDRYVVAKFYGSIEDDMPIYLDETLIEWCGYAGVVRNQKRALLELIKRYEIPIMELNNDEYEELQQSYSNNYPQVDRSRGKNQTKHILIMPDSFQLILLRLPTATGRIIAEHYVNLANTIKLYWRYQAAFYGKKYEDEVKKVCDMAHNIIYSRQQSIKKFDVDLYKKNKVGCVYFICEEGAQDKFKIGWCYHLPTRLAELQISNWRPLAVYNYYFSAYPYDEEQQLHKKYADKKIRGEWFELSHDELQDNSSFIMNG